ITATDTAGNQSQSINYTFTTGQTQTQDTTPPAAVTDLSASNISQTSVSLSWTAPGDDGNTGLASTYDLRYSTSTITASNWNNAAQLSGEPTPGLAGQKDIVYISVGLSPNTAYYFAIKTKDEIPNTSSLSNVLAVTTLAETVNTDANTNTGGSAGGSSSNAGSGGNTGSVATGGSVTDTTPPAKPSGFRAIPAEKQITLKWTNPKDADFVRVIIVRKEGGSPTSMSDGETIYEGTKEEHTDINLDNSKDYYYSIYAFDKKPNYSEAETVSTRPKEGETTITTNIAAPASYPYSAGHLLRAKDGKRVYIVDSNNQKRWVVSMEAFKANGYDTKDVRVVEQGILDMYAEGEKITGKTDIAAIKATATKATSSAFSIPDYFRKASLVKLGSKIYAIVKSKQHRIINKEVFDMYKFAWSKVKTITPANLAKYPRTKLIKSLDSVNVYYLTDRGQKKRILNRSVFESYGNKWGDVIGIMPDEFKLYADVKYVRYGGNIYVLEGATARPITEEAFGQKGYKLADIVDINETEFGGYVLGERVE
ncbi:MAG: fibronectin type III domain-containing protein, partial [Patescibacteria group bacterium]